MVSLILQRRRSLTVFEGESAEYYGRHGTSVYNITRSVFKKATGKDVPIKDKQ